MLGLESVALESMIGIGLFIKCAKSAKKEETKNLII
jgi:hypothetical protein